VILYEYPLNERVRTLLRLEDLFERMDHFVRGDHPFDHHIALTTMFEVTEVASRADLKSDLLQELERQKQTLLAFRNNPAVSADALEKVLQNIEQAASQLGASTGKIGNHLRDNEWLMAIRSRAIIPGGACEFDLPSYYAWQANSRDRRQADIDQWMAPFKPLKDSLGIVLNLLRESGHGVDMLAANGSYQQQLGGRLVQMLQVGLDPQLAAIPEISANKYMLWIRFTNQDPEAKAKTFEGDVPFKLSLCSL
jgi:cell division protein ZapD